MDSVSEKLLGELMDFSTMIAPDLHAAGYNWYHIEFPRKEIGFNISARQIPNGLVGCEKWEIRTYNTYNV